MDIIFLDEGLRRTVNSEKRLRRKFPGRRGKLLRQRLDELRAAVTLEDMRGLPGRCHELKHDRTGQLAIGLEHPYRLIFEPANNPIPRYAGGNLDWTRVTAIRIIEVVDYHD